MSYSMTHADVITWKRFPRYWPFVGEFTGRRWIPLTKDQWHILWYFNLAYAHGWFDTSWCSLWPCNAIIHPPPAISCVMECQLCFYQTRSAWSMDQGSNRKHSAVHNLAPTVTKFCVMWEGQALPHDTKFSNCRCEIVGRRVIFIWFLIPGSSWSGLIKAEPELHGSTKHLFITCLLCFLCVFVISKRLLETCFICPLFTIHGMA